jgi:hypothetical protein
MYLLTIKKIEEPWLLIFDQVEDFRSLEDYWPKSAHSHSFILLTSQYNFATFTNHALLLPPLNPEDGARMITMARYPNQVVLEEDQNAALLFSRDVGHHPLALAQVAAYIALTSPHIVEAYRHFRKSSYDIWSNELQLRVREYGNCLMDAWDSALNELHPCDILLLQVMALLPSEIPVPLLLSYGTTGGIGGANTRASELL